MLVELTINQEAENRLAKVHKELKENGYYENLDSLEFLSPNHPHWRPMKGVYEGPFSDPNFEYLLYDEFRKIDRQPIFECYGVADNVEQILKYHRKEFIDTPEKYILFFTKIYQNKENKGSWGGWRWHKWGPYIGKLNPQCEYLDDEEFGEDFPGYVLVYEFFKVPD